MGFKTGAQMVTEMQRRIIQLSSADALEALNRAIRWTNRQGSFTFQLATPSTLSVTNGASVSLPADMDDGKDKVFLNSNGVAIVKSNVADVDLSNNYNTPTPTDSGTNIFDKYFIKTGFSSGIPASVLYLYPVLSPVHTVSVTVVYHKITVDIANTGASYTNLPRDFDDVIIDIAESEERRIYDVGETWSSILARSQDQIKVMLDGYRSSTIEPMPMSEAQSAAQEKGQLGRA